MGVTETAEIDRRMTAGMEAALTALEAAGIPRAAVVLGVCVPSSNRYETHVGSTREGTYDDASMLAHVARDLRTEADQQAMAMFRKESCPSCGSPRWAFMRKRRNSRRGESSGIYIDCWDECMDCGHKVAER